MSIFKRKQVQKESNIATTPIEKTPVETFSKKKFYLLLWHIISLALYLVYIFYFIIKIAQGNFLSRLIFWLIYGYIAAFFIIVIISIGNKRKLKSRMKSFKSAVKFLKYFIQIVTFVMSIVTAISAFIATGKFDMSALIYAFVSLILTIIMVLFEVIKIVIRKNIPTVKHNFLEMREKREEELVRLGKKKKKKKEEVFEEDEDAIRYDYGEDDEPETTTPSIDTNFDKPEEPQKKQIFKNFFQKFKSRSVKQINKINEGTDNYSEIKTEDENENTSAETESPATKTETSYGRRDISQSKFSQSMSEDYDEEDYNNMSDDGTDTSLSEDENAENSEQKQPGKFSNKIQSAFKKIFKKN